MTTLLLLLRGLRSRALLSTTGLLLMVVALAGTVLGPAFQDAVTESYTLTSLDETDAPLTALSLQATPGADGTLDELADEAVSGVREVLPDAYTAPEVVLRAGPFLRSTDVVEFSYVHRAGACDLLTVQGRCPEKAGEVMLHEDDLFSRAVGDVVRMPGLPGTQKIVGSYETPPDTTEWLLPGRLASRPSSASVPYQPAPAFVSEDALAALPRDLWSVQLDSRLAVPEGLDDRGLARLVDGVRRAQLTDLALPGGGRLTAASEINSLPAVLADVRVQRDVARSTMTPAVVSLSLLALAVILRLQSAAAEQRAPELALAALRGLGSRRTWLLGLAEPWLLLALATPLGLLGGYAAARGLAAVWLRPGTPVSLPAGSWVGGGLVVAAIAAVSAYAVGQELRETLASRVAGVRRPAGTGGSRRTGVVVEVLLVTLAVVLPLARIGRSDSGLGLADLLLPVVTAVAAGLVVTRLTGALASWWARRSTGGPMSVYVAVRALARRSQGTLVILPVAAAIAVAVFASGISAVASDWRESVAATSSPGDEVWESPLGPGPTSRLTREVDPDGRWTMSVARLDAPGAPPVVMVDSERLARVGRWPEQWLGGRDGAAVADLLAPAGPAVRLTGERIGLTADTGSGAGGPVTVVLVVDDGSPEAGYLRLGPFGPGTSTRTTTSDLCRDTCEVRELRLEGDTAVRLSALTVDDAPATPSLLETGWQAVGPTRLPLVGPAPVEDGRLVVEPGDELVPAIAAGPLPLVAGVDADLTADQRADGLDLVDSTVAVDEVAVSTSLPLVGPAGVVVDESSLLARIDPGPFLATADVVVRADTPDDVRAALLDAGLVRGTGYPETRRSLDDGAYGQALRLYAVVAAILLGMALVGLLVSTAVQLPQRRRDAASLRVVAVPRRTVVLASLWESLVVLGAAAVAGLGAGLLAERVLVGSLTLGRADDPTSPAVHPVTDTAGLLLLVGAVVAVLLVVATLSSVAVVRGARGATLRESAR